MDSLNLEIKNQLKNHQVVITSIDTKNLGILRKEFSWPKLKNSYFLVNGSGEKLPLGRSEYKFLLSCHFFYADGETEASVIVDVNASEQQLALMRQVIEILEEPRI